MFVRFECGCIGLPPEHFKTQGSIAFSYCVDDRLSCYLGTFRDKEYEELTPEELSKFMGELRNRINMGYKFEELRNLLKE